MMEGAEAHQIPGVAGATVGVMADVMQVHDARPAARHTTPAVTLFDGQAQTERQRAAATHTQCPTFVGEQRLERGIA